METKPFVKTSSQKLISAKKEEMEIKLTNLCDTFNHPYKFLNTVICPGCYNEILVSLNRRDKVDRVYCEICDAYFYIGSDNSD